MVLLDGLEEGSASVLGRIETGPYLVTQGAFPDWEPLPPSETEPGVGGGWLRPGLLTSEGEAVPVRVLALTNLSLLGLARGPSFDELLLHPALRERTGLTAGGEASLAFGDGSWELRVGAALRPGVVLPEPWVLVNESFLREALTGSLARVPSFDFLLTAEREDAARLAVQGYDVQPLAAGGDFFLAGLREARRLLLSVVVAGSVAVGVVAYSLLALEIRYRRAELRTLRAVGMDDPALLRLYGLQVAFVVGAGTVLGVALGIVAANGLVSFAPFFGLPTLIRPHVTAFGLLVPLLSALAAGLAGGFLSLAAYLGRDAHDAPG